MALIEINPDPSPRELRWFGLLLLAFFALVSGVVWWRTGHSGAARGLLAIGGAVSALYYLAPRLRRAIYLGWMYGAWPIGLAVSTVLLAVVYFLVLAPIGLMVRLIAGDPLRRGFDSRLKSYWTPRPPTPPLSRYFRQF